jgi:hypothetical protein
VKGKPQAVAHLLSKFLPRRLRNDDEARAALIWIAYIGEHIPALVKALTTPAKG